MHGIIYLATFPNGKKYVGQTTWSLEHRSTISQCCSGTRESTGRHPVTNEKMMWEYVS